MSNRIALCQKSDTSQAPVPSAFGCNKDGSAIEASVMPYAVKFYAYIFVANVLAFL
jgi:hypothetical protein